jgi:predicted dehydrogenase
MITGMRAVRVAVIGAGFMGERHARIYAGLPDVELVAICDVRESAAQELAERTGASAHYADFAELLRRDDLDAVSVCTPDALHREPCELALAGGRHVLVEKPIATTVVDAEAIVAAARRAGSALLVGHCLRFDPATTRPVRRSREASWVPSRRSTRGGPTPWRRRIAWAGGARSRYFSASTTTT